MIEPTGQTHSQKLQKVTVESTNVTGSKRDAPALPETAKKVSNKRAQSSAH